MGEGKGMGMEDGRGKGYEEGRWERERVWGGKMRESR